VLNLFVFKNYAFTSLHVNVEFIILFQIKMLLFEKLPNTIFFLILVYTLLFFIDFMKIHFKVM